MTAPALLVKKRLGFLSAGDPHAKAIIDKMGLGECALFSIRRVRNPKFHRKVFAMLAFAYDHWEQPERFWSGQVVICDRESFRKDLTIAAGYFDVILGINGETRLEAKSLAFDRMDEGEFSALYEAICEVLSRGFLPGINAETMESWANQYAETA